MAAEFEQKGYVPELVASRDGVIWAAIAGNWLDINVAGRYVGSIEEGFSFWTVPGFELFISDLGHKIPTTDSVQFTLQQTVWHNPDPAWGEPPKYAHPQNIPIQRQLVTARLAIPPWGWRLNGGGEPVNQTEVRLKASSVGALALDAKLTCTGQTWTGFPEQSTAPTHHFEFPGPFPQVPAESMHHDEGTSILSLRLRLL